MGGRNGSQAKRGDGEEDGEGRPRADLAQKDIDSPVGIGVLRGADISPLPSTQKCKMKSGIVTQNLCSSDGELGYYLSLQS